MSTTLCTGGTGGKMALAWIGVAGGCGCSSDEIGASRACKLPNGGMPARAAVPDTTPAPNMSTT
jgi:hypothetical protein